MGNGHWQLEGSATELYRRYLVPAITTKWAEDLVGRARPRAEEAALDVACGTGVVARLAAKAGAKVTGLDLNPGMLAVARRVPIEGAPIHWIEGSALAPPATNASPKTRIHDVSTIFFLTAAGRSPTPNVYTFSCPPCHSAMLRKAILPMSITLAITAISVSTPAAADTSISCLSHLVEQQNHDGTIEKRPASPSHRILVYIDGTKVMVLRTNGTPPVTLGIQEDSPKQMVANQITANGQILVVWFKPQRAIRFALFISQVGEFHCASLEGRPARLPQGPSTTLGTSQARVHLLGFRASYRALADTASVGPADASRRLGIARSSIYRIADQLNAK